MSPRQMRVSKAGRYYNLSVETFIERVRKARALGCNLSYLGIDSQMTRKTLPSRNVVLTK
jgi:hypothetical protein